MGNNPAYSRSRFQVIWINEDELQVPVVRDMTLEQATTTRSKLKDGLPDFRFRVVREADDDHVACRLGPTPVMGPQVVEDGRGEP